MFLQCSRYNFVLSKINILPNCLILLMCGNQSLFYVFDIVTYYYFLIFNLILHVSYALQKPTDKEYKDALGAWLRQANK